MKSGEAGVLELNDWLLTNLSAGSVVSVDPSLMIASAAKSLIAVLGKQSIQLLPASTNPVDDVWGHGSWTTPNLTQLQPELYTTFYTT